jgi:hypothetical protein
MKVYARPGCLLQAERSRDPHKFATSASEYKVGRDYFWFVDSPEVYDYKFVSTDGPQKHTSGS